MLYDDDDDGAVDDDDEYVVFTPSVENHFRPFHFISSEYIHINSFGKSKFTKIAIF